MADNVLKGVLDAIAESDNETAGQLITRLSESHIYGRDDGELQTASPTHLISPVDVFQASDVGKELDIIEPLVGASSGFEATYLVGSYIDAKTITLTLLDGTPAAFTSVNPVRWRFATLRVETTLDFKQRDRRLVLWVGEEADLVHYAELVQIPGAQEFRGLGRHRLSVLGGMSVASPATLTTPGEHFTAADVGRALYILPADTLTGNEGRQLITAVAGDGQSVTLSPGGLVNEDLAWFVIKDYTGEGYLTGLRPPSLAPRALDELSEVVDGSQSFSSIDRLRRAMLVDYATGEELDRIGRNLAVSRLLGVGDETMRRLLQTLAYLPRATVYGLELVLEALFPGGGYTIYEDLTNFPNKVFILIEALGGDSEDFEGKAFLAPTGKVDVTAPHDPAAGGPALGAEGRELQTSTSTTAVTVWGSPINVVDVLAESDVEQAITWPVTALPSAYSPAWTFYPQGGAPAEGTIFGVTAQDLHQSFVTGTEGGHYRRAAPTQEYHNGSFCEISTTFKFGTIPTPPTTGLLGGLYYEDTTVNAKVGFWFGGPAPDGTGARRVELGSLPGALEIPYRLAQTDLLTLGSVTVRLRRYTEGDAHYFSAWIGGEEIFAGIPASAFTAAAADEVGFGYWVNGTSHAGNSTQWANVEVTVNHPKNYWNLSARTGLFSGTDDSLTITGGLLVAGDLGKHVRIHTTGGTPAASLNVGLWQIKSFVSVNEVELEGIVSEAIAGVETDGTDPTPANNTHRVTLLDPYFVPTDVGKELEILGSSLGNDGPRVVLEYVNPWQVVVDEGSPGADFTLEANINFRFNPFDGTTSGNFVAASGFTWELIDAASFAGSVLTLREALPQANTDVQIWYTSVLSAQILRNEFVINDGSSGSAPDVYYPFYVFDVDRATRQLLDEVTAAGVLPAFEREF